MRLKAGLFSALLGSLFGYLQIRTNVNGLLGINNLCLYLAIGCYTIAFLYFVSGLNKLSKKMGTNLGRGVSSAILGAIFNYLHSNTGVDSILAGISGVNNLCSYLSMAFYAIALLYFISALSKLSGKLSTNVRFGIFTAVLGSIFSYLHTQTSLGNLLGGMLGIYAIFSYLAMACYGLTLLCFASELNKYLKKLSINVRIGVSSTVLGLIIKYSQNQTALFSRLGANDLSTRLVSICFIIAGVCFALELFKVFRGTTKKTMGKARNTLDEAELSSEENGMSRIERKKSRTE